MADIQSGDSAAGDGKGSDTTVPKSGFMLRPSAFNAPGIARPATSSAAGEVAPSSNSFAVLSAHESDDDNISNRASSDTSSVTASRFMLRPSSLDKHASTICKDSSVASSPFRAGSVGFKLEPAKLCSPLSSRFTDNNKSGSGGTAVKTDGQTTSSSLPSTTSSSIFTTSISSSVFSSSFVLGQKPDSTIPVESDVQAPVNTSNLSSASVVSSSSDNQAPATTSSFVFGSNLADRVIAAPASSTTTSSHPQNGGGEADSLQADHSPSRAEGLTDTPTVPAAHSLVESAALQSAAKQNHVELKEVEVVTGEEGESNVFQINVKLFVFDTITQNWAEKGIGLLRLNDRKTDSGAFQSRLVMRIGGSMRVVLNSMIWSGMLVERASKKSVKISAVDPDDGHSIKIFLIQAHLSDTENIFSAINSRLQKLKTSEGVKKQTTLVKDTSSVLPGDAFGCEKRACSADTDTDIAEKRQRLDPEQRRDPPTGEESTDSSAIDPETEASNEGYASSPVVHSTSSSSEA